MKGNCSLKIWEKCLAKQQIIFTKMVTYFQRNLVDSAGEGGGKKQQCFNGFHDLYSQRILDKYSRTLLGLISEKHC